MILESIGFKTAASMDGGSHPTFGAPPSSHATLYGNLPNKFFLCGMSMIANKILVVHIASIMCDRMAFTTTKLDNLLKLDGYGNDQSMCMWILDIELEIPIAKVYGREN